MSGHGIYGWLFIADSVGFLVATWWLYRAPGVTAWRFAGVLSALTVAGFVFSRTTGLPGLHDEVWDFVGSATTGAEFLVVVGAVLATRTAGRRRPATPPSRSYARGAAAPSL